MQTSDTRNSMTRKLTRSGLLVGALLMLGGCVYGPDYGYVRGDGYNGDAYYGTEYGGGPAYGYGYDPWGYGYGYGSSIGLGYYYGNHRHYYDRGHGWNGGGDYGRGIERSGGGQPWSSGSRTRSSGPPSGGRSRISAPSAPAMRSSPSRSAPSRGSR